MNISAAGIVFLLMWGLCAASLMLAAFEIDLRARNPWSCRWLGLPIRRRELLEPFQRVRQAAIQVERVGVTDVNKNCCVFVVSSYRHKPGAGVARGVIRGEGESTEIVCHFPLGLALFFAAFMVASSSFAFSGQARLAEPGTWFLLLFMNGLPAGMWWLIHSSAVSEAETAIQGIEQAFQPADLSDSPSSEHADGSLKLPPNVETRVDGTPPGWRALMSIDSIFSVVFVTAGLLAARDHWHWGMVFVGIGMFVFLAGLRPVLTSKDLYIKVNGREVVIQGVRSSHQIPISEIEKAWIPDFYDDVTHPRRGLLVDQVCIIRTTDSKPIATDDVYLSRSQQHQVVQHINQLIHAT